MASTENPSCRRPRAPSFKLEIPGNAEVKSDLMLKLGEVKKKMVAMASRPVNNADILEGLMDSWLRLNSALPAERPVIHQPMRKAMANSQLYVTTKNSLQKFASTIENHSVNECK